MLQYLAKFEPAEEGGYVVTFPDFTWGVTQGDSAEEAMEMAADALAMVIAECIERGKELPPAGRHRGSKFRVVRLPLLQDAKAELYREFCQSGIRKAEFARRMGISKGNVERLFDLNHHSRMDQIETAFRVLGKTLTLDVRDAA
jgi:antitoxin HicB